MVRRMMAFCVVLAVTFSVAMPSFAMSVDEFAGGGSNSVYQIEDDTVWYDVSLADSGISPLASLNTSVTQRNYTDLHGGWFTYYQIRSMDDSTLMNALNSNFQEYLNWFRYLDDETYKNTLAIDALSAAGGLTPDNLNTSGGFPVSWDGQSFTLGSFADMFKYFIRSGFDVKSLPSDTLAGMKNNTFSYSTKSGDLENQSFDSLMSAIADSLIKPYGDGLGSLYLAQTGLDASRKGGGTVYDLIRESFVGLAHVLRGSSNSAVSGTILDYTDLSESTLSSRDVLHGFKILYPIQNDLARIAHVIADPQDQAIKDANKDNYQAIEEVTKGDASVKPSDIGDMAGVSEGLTGNLNTGVTVGDMFGQLNDNSRFSFFSQETANQLDTVPVSASDYEDDFVHFYDPENSDFWSLLGRDKP